MNLTQSEFEILNRAVAIAETLAKDHKCPADYVADANKARVLLLGANLGRWTHPPGTLQNPVEPQPFPHGRWTPKAA